VRRPRMPARRGLHGDVTGTQHRAARFGRGGEQGVIFGAWLSASVLDVFGDHRSARRLAATGLAAAVPAAVAGAADWSEQHEQQMRVGVVHAAANLVVMSLYGASLVSRGPRLGQALRLAGLASVAASGLAGGHISFRLAGGPIAPSRCRTWSSPAGSISCRRPTCPRASRYVGCSGRSR
jgi:hypothetical protein